MKISVLLRAIVLSVLLLSWAIVDLHAADMSRLYDRECTGCHGTLRKAFAKEGAAHSTEIGCKDCHLEHPKQRGSEFAVAKCSTCHDPQDNKHFSANNCRACHHPHRPLIVDFSHYDKPIKQLCFSCHDNPYKKGSVHAQNLRCNQCHPQHGQIPNCLDCHDSHTGGKIKENCLGCHDAHNPTPGKAAKGLTANSCTACHGKTKKFFAKVGGAHAEVACNECHEAHGDKPDCTKCHEGHNEKMVGSDCTSCHSHHQPMPPVFNSATKSDFCVDCHAEVADYFEESGAAHRQNLQCTDCHQKHPPATDVAPKCSSCHDSGDNSHFAVENCQQCHDPHSPKVGDFSQVGSVRSICGSCHSDVIDEMNENPTAHQGALDCTQCHEAHDHLPACLDCHEGHGEDMEGVDCSQCHKPHSPLPATFTEEVTVDTCVTCHSSIVEEVESGGRAHKTEISCIECHQDHPPGENVIPECSDCHAPDDAPHFASEGCLDCHNPHQPLKDDLVRMRGHRSVCAGCHPQVEAQLVKDASAHDRDCVACHRRHTGVPSCLGCHFGHGEQMSKADCKVCHQAHAPLAISFEGNPAPRLCADCHNDITETMNKSGAAHRDKATCASCHQDHPDVSCVKCHSEHPQKGAAIPDSCFLCHAPSEQRHFTVGRCTACHMPHQPLELNLQGVTPLAPVCVSCHTQVEQQFTEMPSGHSQQDCASCHSEHKRIRICLDCHAGHGKSMVQSDCVLCHLPHQPQNITLQQNIDIPIDFCAACHATQAGDFVAKGAAHQQEFSSCTACHPEHKPNGKTTTKQCNSCHSRATRRHFVVDNCAGCHNPHKPLELQLDKQKTLKPICLSCHNNQERLYEQYPNKHTSFDCRKCHPGQHGSLMECQQCHSPHIPDMTQIDCMKCHPAHLPHMIKEKPGQVGPVCISCHKQPAALLEQKGEAHKKQPCVSCHRSHPPFGETVMPKCSICHDEDQPHFAVGNCQDCHQGHDPLGHDLSKAKNANPACLACHEEVEASFAVAASAHVEQGCNSCHPQHGQAQQCAACHDPHVQGQSYADCLTCHSMPHAPTQIAFEGNLPNRFCQSCHEDQFSSLARSKEAHHELSCTECHGGKHGSMLNCATCHEPPHDPGLHSKYPDCLKCHIDPHDLADWRSGDAAAKMIPKSEPKPAPVAIPAVNDAASSEGVK
ncbi:cytochrome c3 family protein [Malonomonas rubra]|uniref:cytochrome c3 family protein n=1 Tax=Malonomonas rubra TaxID=57040 RepID=UPI0026EA25E3|nr:cytochrome c3 family protein [Malonomonas rubra]